MPYQDLGFEKEEDHSDLGFEREPQPIKPTKLESGLLGAAQGASFGFADELEGALRAGRDVITGPSKLSEFPERYRARRDAARADYERARGENPGSFTTGEVAGGVGTAFIPGLGWANAGKAGMLAKMAQGAKVGALQGLGTSDADVTKGDSGNAIEDTLSGAATGAGTAGLLDRIGATLKGITPSSVAKKLSSVFLNTPEEITDTYIKNPQGVLNAPRRHELAGEYQGLLDKLKGEVTEGSQASRDILRNEGRVIKGNEIQDILGSEASNIAKRSEGVMDDPSRSAAYSWLKNLEEKYGPIDPEKISRNSGQMLEDGQRDLSTNRVKDILQTIDRSVDYETAPGKFGKIDEGIKKNVRSKIDELLKRESPAYTEQMKQVASDTGLLKDASDVGKSPQGLANIFRRIETDQYGGGQVPRDVLEKFGNRMGTDLLEKAKLSNAREAFDKSVTNGSRNVNFFSNALKEVPIVKYLAPVLGGTVDKYGRKMTMAAADAAMKLDQVLQQKGPQEFMQNAAPLIEAAQKGNPSAILTFQLLSKSNPQALKYLNQGEPVNEK